MTRLHAWLALLLASCAAGAPAPSPAKVVVEPEVAPATSSVCPTGHADCNGVEADGCEVDITSSEVHCGACDTACGRFLGAVGVCARGACFLACDEGRADCNQRRDDGCEASLRHDAASCGACGTVCPNGCRAGECAKPAETILFTDGAVMTGAVIEDGTDVIALVYNRHLPRAGGRLMRITEGKDPVQLATGFGISAGLVAHASGYYFLGLTPAGQRLLRVAKRGGAPTSLSPAAGGHVVRGREAVYFPRSQGIARFDFASGKTTDVVRDSGRVTALAVSGDDVYWIDETTGALRRQKQGAATETIVESELALSSLAVDATHVYWGSVGGASRSIPPALMRRTVTGGPIETFAPLDDFATAIALAPPYVYVIHGISLSRIPMAGGEAEFLGQTIGGLAIGAVYVYSGVTSVDRIRR